MKLSLQLILETLTEYGAQLIETDGDFTFTGVQILTSPTDILEPDTRCMSAHRKCSQS